jgi:hypothetical protein
MVLKSMTFFETMNIFEFFLKYVGKTVGAGAGARVGAAQKWSGSATLVHGILIFEIIPVKTI